MSNCQSAEATVVVTLFGFLAYLPSTASEMDSDLCKQKLLGRPACTVGDFDRRLDLERGEGEVLDIHEVKQTVSSPWLNIFKPAGINPWDVLPNPPACSQYTPVPNTNTKKDNSIKQNTVPASIPLQRIHKPMQPPFRPNWPPDIDPERSSNTKSVHPPPH